MTEWDKTESEYTTRITVTCVTKSTWRLYRMFRPSLLIFAGTLFFIVLGTDKSLVRADEDDEDGDNLDLYPDGKTMKFVSRIGYLIRLHKVLHDRGKRAFQV